MHSSIPLLPLVTGVGVHPVVTITKTSNELLHKNIFFIFLTRIVMLLLLEPNFNISSLDACTFP